MLIPCPNCNETGIKDGRPCSRCGDLDSSVAGTGKVQVDPEKLLKFLSPQRSVLTVAIIVKRNRRVLMLKRAKGTWPGFWCLPGGKVEWGESFLEAGKRELEEEVGLHATNFLELATTSYVFGNSHWLSVVLYATDALGNALNKEGPETHSDMDWFQQAKPPKIMIPSLMDFIDRHPRLWTLDGWEYQRLMGIQKGSLRTRDRENRGPILID
jgi:8-oxo-dGTP diphosphatase